MDTLQWKSVETSGIGMPNVSVFRAKVPGGWLVFVDRGGANGLTFVPDADNKWA